MSSVHRRDFEAHNRSQAGAVKIFEFREVERDATPAQNQRLDNLAHLGCVLAEQSAPALDDRQFKVILIPGLFDLVMEGSAECSRHIYPTVKHRPILIFQ